MVPGSLENSLKIKNGKVTLIFSNKKVIVVTRMSNFSGKVGHRPHCCGLSRPEGVVEDGSGDHSLLSFS